MGWDGRISSCPPHPSGPEASDHVRLVPKSSSACNAGEEGRFVFCPANSRWVVNLALSMGNETKKRKEVK
jgi:hypothetical protein